MTFNLTSQIFTDILKSKEFLLDNQIIEEEMICMRCNSICSLYVITERTNKFLIYKCSERVCRKRKRLLKTKIDLNRLLQIIYLLMADCSYRQIFLFHKLSDSTIARIKNKLYSCIERYMSLRPITLGGPGINVEVDETVLSRRGVIRNPTRLDDTTRDTVWIVGAIDNSERRNFFLSRINNRQIETLTNVLEGVINTDSILISDGHPSYPSVARNLGFTHRVVNHTHGFVAEDGTHTNNIESFWGHFKNTMRKENGVRRNNIDRWIVQYTFKRRYTLKCSRIEFLGVYIEILRYYFD